MVQVAQFHTTPQSIQEKKTAVADAEQALKAAETASPQNQEAIAAATTSLENAKRALNEVQATLQWTLQANSASDGTLLSKADNFTPERSETDKKGLYALEKADLFNLLCVPPYTSDGNVEVSLVSEAAAYCEKRRAMLLVDPPSDWTSKQAAVEKIKDNQLDHIGTRSKNAALFFPRIKKPNPPGQPVEEFVPAEPSAGIFSPNGYPARHMEALRASMQH